MKINFLKITNFIINCLLFIIIFYTPLHFCFYLESNEIFEFHKFFLFRILFFALISFWFLKLVFFIDIKKIKELFFYLFKRYLWPIFALLAFSLLAVLWSIDPIASLFGSLDRQFGWFNYLFLAVFLILLVLEIIISENSIKKIKFFLLSTLVSSFLVSVYAVFQFFSLDLFQWSEPAHLTGRSFSTLGQPNLLGIFLILNIPLSFYFFKKTKRLIARFFYIFVFLFQLLALFFSGSRSSWIGLLIAISLTLFFFYFKKNKRLFFVSFLGLIFLINFLFIFNKSFSDRVYSSFKFSSGSAAARVWVWSGALDAFWERPFGYGLENQREALIPFYEIKWARVNVVNVVFDRSHNVFLDVLLCLGFIGFFLFCYSLFLLFKLLLKGISDKKNRDIFIFISSSFLAYLVSLQFNFSSLPIVILFLTLLSFVFALDAQKTYIANESYYLSFKKNKKKGTRKFYIPFFVFVVFCFSFLGIKNELNNLKNDYYFFQSKIYLSQGMFSEGLLMFSYINNGFSPYNDYAYYFADVFLGNYARDYFQERSLDFLIKKEIEKSLKKSKYNNLFSNKNSFFFQFFEARALSILGNQKSSEKIFLDLIKRSPYFPDLYLNYARHKIIFGDLNDSIKLLYKSLEMLPKEGVESDVSRNFLSFYERSVFYEISSVYFKIKENDVK